MNTRDLFEENITHAGNKTGNNTPVILGNPTPVTLGNNTTVRMLFFA